MYHILTLHTTFFTPLYTTFLYCTLHFTLHYTLLPCILHSYTVYFIPGLNTIFVQYTLHSYTVQCIPTLHFYTTHYDPTQYAPIIILYTTFLQYTIHSFTIDNRQTSYKFWNTWWKTVQDLFELSRESQMSSLCGQVYTFHWFQSVFSAHSWVYSLLRHSP